MAVATAGLNVTVHPATLADAVGKAIRAVPSRAVMPVLSGLLVETAGDGLQVTGTDLATGIRCWLPAEVHGEGAAVVPAKLLAGALSGLVDDLSLHLDSAGALRLTSARVRTSIQCQPAADFPPGPRPEGGERIEMSFPDLAAAIERTARFAAADDKRPVYTSVMFTVEESGVYLVASDGYRLAESRIDAEVKAWVERMLVPSRALRELPRIFKGAGDMVELLVAPAGNQVWFRGSNVELAVRLIDGTYPNYRQVIADRHTTTVRIASDVLKQALEATVAFAGDDFTTRLVVSEGCLTVSAGSQLLGDSVHELDAETEGDAADLRLNGKWLAEALDVLPDLVEIRLNGPRQPALIVNPLDDDYRHVVLPRTGGA